MSFSKRPWLSITRKKSKSTLLFFILPVVAVGHLPIWPIRKRSDELLCKAQVRQGTGTGTTGS